MKTKGLNDLLIVDEIPPKWNQAQWDKAQAHLRELFSTGRLVMMTGARADGESYVLRVDIDA